MTVLYIFLGILAALVLPLCVRVRLTVRYEEKLRSVKIGWLFFSFRLYPQKIKPAGKQKAKGKKPETKTKKSKDKPKGKDNLLQPYWEQEGISGILYLLSRTLEALGGLLGGLRRGLLIHDLEVYVDVASGDAAQTAILYGSVCGAVYPLVSKIITSVRTVKYNVDVNPEYLAAQSRADLYASVSLRPVRVLWELILLLARLFWRVLRPVLKASKNDKISVKELANGNQPT